MRCFPDHWIDTPAMDISMASYSWWTIRILLVQFCSVALTVPERFIATECFGSVLSLSCRTGHRIKVVDDFFGLSAAPRDETVCQYVPGDCTITNNRYSSVVHRYCEGLESCTRFQVDRRNCGANLTNYEQVEYECVPDSDVIDICSRVSLRATAGYIATPNFPNEYSPESHCRCRLRPSKEGLSVRLAFTQFIVKYDQPCQDWVDVVLDGESRRICGAYRSTLNGERIDLVFHSDGRYGHQGFWLNFKAYPAELSGEVLVDCAPEPYVTTTTAPTPAPTTPASSRTQQDYIDDVIEWNLIEKRIEDRLVDRLEKEAFYEKDIPRYKGNHNDVISNTGYEADAIVAPPVVPPLDEPRSQNPDEDVDQDVNNMDTSKRENSRTTGIIIISICVGGILLLILILTVLLCVNKRRNPKRQTLAEKKEKIQQRPSSLSFYDSIPLYDSIGRKGGVARAPPVCGDRNGNGRGREAGPCLSGGKCMAWKSEAPYWTTLHAELLDSDHDSAMYAELGRHSPGGATSSLDSPEVRKVVAPETAHAYSVSLEASGKVTDDDVSTHV